MGNWGRELHIFSENLLRNSTTLNFFCFASHDVFGLIGEFSAEKARFHAPLNPAKLEQYLDLCIISLPFPSVVLLFSKCLRVSGGDSCFFPHAREKNSTRKNEKVIFSLLSCARNHMSCGGIFTKQRATPTLTSNSQESRIKMRDRPFHLNKIPMSQQLGVKESI